MPARTLVSAAAALFFLQPLAVAAQGTVTPLPAAQEVEPPPAGVAIYKPQQLDQLLAPIALYPDELLTQIMMAAQYPAEIADANRWVRDPANANLRGDALAAALEPIDWDPAVKSLVPFPQVLQMMAEQGDWTRELGDAFVTQQAEVMDAVQRLRRAAEVAGRLQSSDQLTVTSADDTITIRPAAPEIVYVPVYDPRLVYGPWPYPDYPPYAFYAPNYYVAPAVYGGLGFGTGIIIVRQFWGWQHCDWRHHRIFVDTARVNVINARFAARDHWRSAERGWTFDPHHRRGVGFATTAARPAAVARPATTTATSTSSRSSAAPWRQQSVAGRSVSRESPARPDGRASAEHLGPGSQGASPLARSERRPVGRPDARPSTNQSPAQLTQNPGFIEISPPARVQQRERERERRQQQSTPAQTQSAAPVTGTTTAVRPQREDVRRRDNDRRDNDRRDDHRRTLPPPAQSSTGFQGAPTTHFQNAPTTHFQNAPTTQFRSTGGSINAPLPSTSVPRAHVAPSVPVPRAHVAPSAPVPQAHVAPSAPSTANTSNGNHGRHHHDR